VDAAVTTPRFTEGTAAEPPRTHLSLLRSTWLSGAVILASGISAGVFAWYVVATHRHLDAARSDLALALLVIGLTVASFGLWYGYSRLLSSRFDLPLEEMLRGDAWSYAPLIGLWLYLFNMPPSLTSASELAGGLLLLCLAAKIGLLARHQAMMHHVATVFVATRLPLIIIAPLASIVIGQRQGQHWSAAHGLLDVWGRWDAQHYLTIATDGYQGKDMAFFPLYPYLVHVLGGLIGDHLTAGLVISNLAFFAALAYLYSLVKLEFGDDTIAYHAIFYTAIFPTAIFFSAVYTESLFFALTVASVYYARRGNYITSGVFGALASLTRVEGVLTAIPLAYEMWRGWKERHDTSLARGVIGLAVVPMGLFGYMAYLYAIVGDPLFFLKIQHHWNRHLAAPWVSIYNTFKEFVGYPLASSGSINHLIELAFTFAFLALMVVAFRTLRPSYAWYFAASLLVPMSTASLMSMPRFVLVIFPAFMLMAIWGRNPLINSAIVSLSLPLLGLFTVLFADWYWLA